MTVILVLVTFLTFIVLDYLLNRRRHLVWLLHRSAIPPRLWSEGTTSVGFTRRDRSPITLVTLAGARAQECSAYGCG